MGKKFDPRDFGIDMDRQSFDAQMIEEFDSNNLGYETVDDLLLHPADAHRFCDDVREKYGHIAEDEVFLKSLMLQRKRPPR